MRLAAYNGGNKIGSSNIVGFIDMSGGMLVLRSDIMGEVVLLCVAGPNIVDATKKTHYIEAFNFRIEKRGRVLRAIETIKSEARFVSEAEFSKMCS